MCMAAFITEGNALRRILDHPTASVCRASQARALPRAAAGFPFRVRGNLASLRIGPRFLSLLMRLHPKSPGAP